MKGFVIYRCRKDGTPYEGTTWTFHPFTGNDAYWEDVCLANERRTETDRSGRFANLRDRGPEGSRRHDPRGRAGRAVLVRLAVVRLGPVAQ